MKRGLLFVALMVFMILPIVSASLQHGILGYVQNAKDGTSANGAIVTFMAFRGTDNYCNLTDIVGKSGNSKQSNWYAQDMGNCPGEWQVGDVVNVNINKGISNSSTSVVLTSTGSDQMPNTQLSSSGKINNMTTPLIVLGILLIILIVIIIILKKQKFKNEKA